MTLVSADAEVQFVVRRARLAGHVEPTPTKRQVDESGKHAISRRRQGARHTEGVVDDAISTSPSSSSQT
jgi:hypothetical protein